jgi:capsular exopolysaccharide synthesis family protein
MSHIFDALQRDENESRGITTSSPTTAKEWLEHAERQARIQRNSESRVATIVEATLWGGDSRQPVARTSLGDSPRPKSEQIRTVPPEVQTLHLTPPFGNRLAALSDQPSPAAEAFRLLCVRLRHLRRYRPLTTLLISSTSPQEGKSLIAANLACTVAAASQQNVLLLEGDVRRPSLGELFRLDQMPGLCEYFRGDRNLKDSIYRLEEAGIWFMPAGRAQGSSLELIQSAQLATTVAQLSHWFDWIIIDSPPILPLADTSVWEKMADGFLLVARRGVTEKRKLRRGAETIDQKKLIGVIVNSSTRSSEEDYYYYQRPSFDSGSRHSAGIWKTHSFARIWDEWSKALHSAISLRTNGHKSGAGRGTRYTGMNSTKGRTG